MMRNLWPIVLILAGCGGRGDLLVSVSSMGTIAGIDHLHTVVDIGNAEATVDVSPPSHPFSLPPAQTFVLVFDPAQDGVAHVTVEATDVSGRPLVPPVSGDASIVAGDTAMLTLVLGGTGGPDLGRTPDLAMADLSPTVDLSMPDLSTTDLAQPDLTPLPDLVTLPDLSCPMVTPDHCGNACVNLATDVANCGACGHACGNGKVCTAGHCACPQPAFAAEASFATPNGGTYAIAFGDFNSDGKPDLVATALAGDPYPGWAYVFPGNGAGGLGAAAVYGTHAYPTGLAVADLNGDGKPDFVVSANGNYHSTNALDVFLNKGDGTFTGPAAYGGNGWPWAVAIGDFDGDGKPDLAAPDRGSGINLNGSTVAVLLASGNGAFQGAKAYAAGSEPLAIAVDDWNGDGKRDVAIADGMGNAVAVLLGKGDGTFPAPALYATGKAPNSVASGDLNGDGKRDLVVLNNADATVSVLLGRGDGTFLPQMAFPVGGTPLHVVVGDVNGDLRPDIAVANNLTANVLLGNGDGTYAASVSFAIAGSAFSLDLGDLNGDGAPDLALSETQGHVGILLNQCVP